MCAPGSRFSSRARTLEEIANKGFPSDSNWAIAWAKAPSDRSIEH